MLNLRRPLFSPRVSLFSKPKMNRTDSPYLDIEREVIIQRGGRPTERNLGPDGTSRFSGKPMEVKYATKGRFRVNRIDHQRMLAKGGQYILVNAAGQQLTMPAWQLDRYIKYKWLKDLRANGRDYSHGFVYSVDLPNNFGGR